MRTSCYTRTKDLGAVINLEATWISAFSIRDYERMTEHAASAHLSFSGGSQS